MINFTSKQPSGSGMIANNLRELRKNLHGLSAMPSPGILTNHTTMGTTRKPNQIAARPQVQGGGVAVWA